MFGVVKEALGGEKFNNDAEVEQYVRNWLLERLSSFFDEGIKTLPIQQRKLFLLKETIWKNKTFFVILSVTSKSV